MAEEQAMRASELLKQASYAGWFIVFILSMQEFTREGWVYFWVAIGISYALWLASFFLDPRSKK
jgi:hypothetical protein